MIKRSSSKITRRAAVKSSIFGLLSVSIPGIIYSKNIFSLEEQEKQKLASRYPSIDDEIVAEVVGKSHFNLERVKELVDKRPELSRATWDWSFGDWETALGAASHVGRRDIAKYLMSKGARPDIFTHAMLGHYSAVKAIVEASPGIQRTPGPHGITLLHHAKAGLRSEKLSVGQKENSKKLIEFLKKLGDSNLTQKHIELTAEEQEKYIGDYMYSEGEKDGLTVKLNMRKMISLGKLGSGGGSLFQKAPNIFAYNGIESVEISFEQKEDKIISLTIHEPDLTLKAIKV